MDRLRTRLAIVAVTGLVVAPAGADWSMDPTINTPVKIGPGFQQVSPSTGVGDGAGGALIFWIDDPYSTPQIWGQRVSADGDLLWPADGVPLCTASGGMSELHAVSDGSGGAILVWRDRRGSDYDYWGQRVDGAGNILWPHGAPSLDGQPLMTVAGEQESLSVMADDAGGVIIVWRHPDTPEGVYAQRINADGDRTWPSGAPADTGAVVCDAASGQLYPSATPDGQGGIIVVWTDTRNNATSNHDVYAQRLDGNGNRLWTADGVAVTQADYGQTDAIAAPTGDGGAIVIWRDFRVSGPVEGIFAQRLDSAGIVQWVSDLLITEELEGNKALVSDGAGGAYAVWRDRRYIAVTDRDLLAQRIGPGGTKLWGADDLPLVVEADSQSNFDVVSAGTGGLYVAWTDNRTGTSDIYAQHVNAAGIISGPVNGAEVCTNASYQGGPTAVVGAPGLIVAWNDYRNTATATDIYAQLVFTGELFSDGFESGGTDRWSLTVP